MVKRKKFNASSENIVWDTKLRAGKLGGCQLVHSLVMCDVRKLNFSVTVLTFGLKAKNFKFINYGLVGIGHARCV